MLCSSVAVTMSGRKVVIAVSDSEESERALAWTLKHLYKRSAPWQFAPLCGTCQMFCQLWLHARALLQLL